MDGPGSERSARWDLVKSAARGTRPEKKQHRIPEIDATRNFDRAATNRARGPDPGTWKRRVAESIADPSGVPGLDPDAPGIAPAHGAFPVRVPPAFAAAAGPYSPADPLWRQVAPSPRELESVPGMQRDPVGDLDARAAPGVIHKYHGRALLIATGACAIHCRYCFRRHFPYAEETAARENWRPAVDYLRARGEVGEVILSGGDPLMLDTPRLARLTGALATIPHLRRIRLHTRMPSVLPERIDDHLLAWLEGLPWQRVLVTHVNHARELGEGSGRALDDLRRAGVVLLNQSVLLREVNDHADAQCALAEALMDHRVLPYYLHLLDPVAGAAHFDVGESRARSLMTALRARLPGYLVPRLVRERAGAPYKLPVL